MRLVERLAAHEIEADAEAVVDLLELDEGELGQLLPGLADGAVDAGLELAEGFARLLDEGGVGLLLLVVAHVEGEQARDGVALEVDRVPVAVDRGHELAELAAPVADVVDAHGAEAERVVQALDRRADDRGAQVADRHRLGDVGRGEVDDDRAPLTLAARPVARRAGGDLAEDGLGEPRAIDGEVEEGAGGLRGDALEARVERCLQLGGHLGGRLSLALGVLEAGERGVPVPGVPRPAELGVFELGLRRDGGPDGVQEGLHGGEGNGARGAGVRLVGNA